MAYCDVGDCTDLAARDGKCWTHYGQLRKHGRVSSTKDKRKAGMTPLQRLTDAALTYAECDTSEDGDPAQERAKDNLCAAAERYTKQLWRARAREAQARARRRGRKPGRPAGSFTGESRWSKLRRQKFAEVLDRAAVPRAK